MSCLHSFKVVWNIYAAPWGGVASLIVRRVECPRCGFRFKFVDAAEALVSDDGLQISIPLEEPMSDEARFGTTQAEPSRAVMSPIADAARNLEVATAIVKDLERKSQDVRDELGGAIRNRDQAEQKLAEVVLPQMKDTTIEQHLKARIERERRPVRE